MSDKAAKVCGACHHSLPSSAFRMHRRHGYLSGRCCRCRNTQRPYRPLYVAPASRAGEEWRTAAHGEGWYEVSTHGRVAAVRLYKNFKPGVRGSRRRHTGYMRVWLSIPEVGRKEHLVHRLVLGTFRGPRGPGQVCRHLNGNPSDNRLENLCWGTQAENIADKWAHGTMVFGEAQSNSKLTVVQVQEIRRRLAQGEAQVALATRYPVTQMTLSQVARGKTWRHLPWPADLEPPAGWTGEVEPTEEGA